MSTGLRGTRRARGRGLCALAAVLAIGLVADAAAAHTRSTSYSSWEIDGSEVRVVFRITQLDLTRLPWGTIAAPHLPAPLAAYLTDVLWLEAGGERCAIATPPRALVAPQDRALVEWELRCANDGPLAIRSEMLLEVAPSHLHFARLRGPGGGITERVLSNAEQRWALPGPDGDEAAAEPVGSSIASYLWIGVEHIASGTDHLVFLLGLLLLARRIRDVVTIVTGFTVAHSLTLGLAAVGTLRPDGAAIESLIGLSIALVAAENAWLLAGRPRIVPVGCVAAIAATGLAAAAGVGQVPALTLFGLSLFTACYFALLETRGEALRLRAAIAFCFGLIHGFGFAGVLTEIALPQGRLLPALLGFNVGVELGQLAIVAAAWPLLRLATRVAAGRFAAPLLESGTAVVAALGVFWFVERAFG